MVATAGAGPCPIPHKLLDVPTLVLAIRYCLTPEALRAARQIASKMQQDEGVKAAVASFHKHLPESLIECDLLPQFPACWRYKKGHKSYRLSKVAAEVLVEHKILDPKKLKL